MEHCCSTSDDCDGHSFVHVNRRILPKLRCYHCLQTISHHNVLSVTDGYLMNDQNSTLSTHHLHHPPLDSIDSPYSFHFHPPLGHIHCTCIRICPKMKKIPQTQRARVVHLLDAGQLTRQIAKNLGMSTITVSRIRKKDISGISKGKGGRPAKLLPMIKRNIRRMILSGKAKIAIQVKSQIGNDRGVDVSADTVRRALKEVGLRAFTKKKKPLLLARHKKERFQFAKVHKDWTVED